MCDVIQYVWLTDLALGEFSFTPKSLTSMRTVEVSSTVYYFHVSLVYICDNKSSKIPEAGDKVLTSKRYRDKEVVIAEKADNDR